RRPPRRRVWGRPVPPCATALWTVRLEIAAVPDCTKKARPALLASSVLPLPVTVTLAVIIGSDCVRVILAVTLMLLSPPLLAAKIALRRAVSFATSTAQADPLPSGDRQVPSSRPAVSARHRFCTATARMRCERMRPSPPARTTPVPRDPLLPAFQADACLLRTPDGALTRFLREEPGLINSGLWWRWRLPRPEAFPPQAAKSAPRAVKPSLRLKRVHARLRRAWARRSGEREARVVPSATAARPPPAAAASPSSCPWRDRLAPTPASPNLRPRARRPYKGDAARRSSSGGSR